MPHRELRTRHAAVTACGWLILVSAGCAGPVQGVERRGEVYVGTAGAERLLALGDPVLAFAVLSDIAPDDASHAYAEELRAFARQQAEEIARGWLKEIDGLLWEERYGAARSRARHLLDRFPLGDDLRGEVQRRLHEVEQGLTEAHANLEELDRLADELLLLGSHGEALSTLEEAYVVARQIDHSTMLERERVLSSLRNRVDAADAAVQKSGKRSASWRPRVDWSFSGSTPPSKREGGRDSAGAAGGALSRPRRLLLSAERYEKRKAYFNAIVAYMKVLELEPKNTQAQAALAILEPDRERLVRELLEAANKRYLKQDLAGAEPYFRKVLLIDSFNEHAMQGLQLFENLKRLRHESGGGS